jgi:methylglyoxal synthase
MEIAIIADDKKKELAVDFCIAYCGILSRHHMCATSKTAKYISEATGLAVESLFTGSLGGIEQVTSRISCNEFDLLLYFRSTENNSIHANEDAQLMRACDIYNIPLATNIATAEVLVRALDRGDLDWREYVNPKSQYRD